MSNEELVKLIKSNINPADNLELLYEQNKNFIRKVVLRYTHDHEDIQDLMQEGYFGLYEAVKKYESIAGVRFMTYAAYWIKQAITNYLKENGRTVRIPSWLYEKIGLYKKELSAFIAIKGRQPSDEEICCCMGINKTTLDTIRQAYQVDAIESLDATVPGSDNEDFTVGDIIHDNTVNVEDTVVDNMMENSRRTELWKIVQKNVNPQENEIINLRYKKDMTLAAAGQQCNVTKERARQIEATALRKLRRAKVRILLSERFEINNAKEYQGGLTRFNNTWSSIVEDIAVKNVDMENAVMG